MRWIFHGENLMWHLTASVDGQLEYWSTACRDIPMAVASWNWAHPKNGISIHHFCMAHSHYQHTDSHTDHATCDRCSNRLHLCIQYIQCNLNHNDVMHEQVILQHSLRKQFGNWCGFITIRYNSGLFIDAIHYYSADKFIPYLTLTTVHSNTILQWWLSWLTGI